MRTPEPPSARRRWLLAAVVLLGAAWFVVVPVLAVRAVLTTATFFGEQASASDHVEQHRRLMVVAGVSLVLVVAGFVLAVRARTTVGSGLFAVLLVPTLVLGVLWLSTGAPQDPPRPAGSSNRASAACQEYSGGDTRCPGG